MTHSPRWLLRPDEPGRWLPPLATATAVALLAAEPAPLLPLARGYRAVCERLPILALLTNHAPALPLALVLGLAAVALVAGGWCTAKRLVGTLRFNRTLARRAAPVPPRLDRAATPLGFGDRLTFLEEPSAAAFCYGFVRPRVAVTAGLLACLDDEELAAVLGHERRHLRRRDPLRYLVLDALAAAAFMFPVAPALRRRDETRMELAADRAALAVAPPGALAGALLAALADPVPGAPGAVGLTATEARIAHLAGRPALPAIPAGSVVVSLGLAGVVVLGVLAVNASAHLVEMICSLCPQTP